MKVGGPKPPPKPSPGVGAAKDAGGPARSDASFAQALERAGAPAAPRETSAAAAAPVAEILAQVRKGVLDGPGAARQMIEKIVAERAAALAPELREKLREALERTLAEDPHLAAKVRQLARAAEEER